MKVTTVASSAWRFVPARFAPHHAEPIRSRTEPDTVVLSAARASASHRPCWRRSALIGLAVLPCLGAPVAALAADGTPQTASATTSQTAATMDVTADAPAAPDLFQRVRQLLADADRSLATSRGLADVHARSGSLDSSFTVASGHVEARHRVESTDTHMKSEVGLVLDGSLVRAALARAPEGDSGWSAGVSSGVHQRQEAVLHHQVGVDAGPGTFQTDRAHVLEMREDAFASWCHQPSDTESASLGLTVGAAQDLLRTRPQTYVEASQSLVHVMGPHANLTARASQGVRNYVRTGTTEAFVEGEAQLSMHYPLKRADVAVGIGSRVAGSRGTPTHIYPDVGVTVGW